MNELSSLVFAQRAEHLQYVMEWTGDDCVGGKGRYDRKGAPEDH